MVTSLAWREPAIKVYRSHRARKTLRILVIGLVVFGLIGFFAAPPLIRSQLQSRLSRALQRPVSVHRGDIAFDDGVLKSHHEIARLELGIPFLASLPSDTDIFVQPLLAMRADASAVRLAGQIKSFASTRESVMHFRLDHLDLPRYLGYVPTLPLMVANGQLSGDLDLHFIADPKTPRLSLTGTLQLDQLVMNSRDSAPLLRLKQVQAQLTAVQPLISRYTLGTLRLDNPELHYISAAGGRST